MTASEFLSIKRRMCRMYVCDSCPLGSNGKNMTCNSLEVYHPEEAIAIAEQWGKEHPLMTNRQKFKEAFGVEPIHKSGYLICPPASVRKYGCKYIKCSECKKWWDEEWKEPSNDRTGCD